jgi:arginine deiminase
MARATGEYGSRMQDSLHKAGISMRLVTDHKVYRGDGGSHGSTALLVRDPI